MEERISIDMFLEQAVRVYPELSGQTIAEVIKKVLELLNKEMKNGDDFLSTLTELYNQLLSMEKEDLINNEGE